MSRIFRAEQSIHRALSQTVQALEDLGRNRYVELDPLLKGLTEPGMELSPQRWHALRA